MTAPFLSGIFATAFVILGGNTIAEARPKYLKRLLVVYPDTKTRVPKVKCADCHIGRGKKVRNAYARKLELALDGKTDVKNQETVEDALTKIGNPPLPVTIVSDMNKLVFVSAVASLPVKGKFFTNEAVKRSANFLPVLLALNQGDLAKRDLHPFLTLSRQLGEDKNRRREVRRVFADIAHPTMKNLWAMLIFQKNEATPDIIKHLQTTLESAKGSQELAEMLGPDFKKFTKQVLKAK